MQRNSAASQLATVMALYSRKYKISVNDPCSESWESMLQAGNSRFCNSCAKHVVDFAAMSDKELIDFLRNRKGASCGRFRPDQLEKVYAERPQLKVPFPKRFVRFVVSLFIGSVAEKASAQTDTLPVTPIDTIAKYIAIDSLKNDTAFAGADPIPEQEQLQLSVESPEILTITGPVIEGIHIEGIVLGSFMPEPVEEVPFPPFRQWIANAKRRGTEIVKGHERKPEPRPRNEDLPETAVLPSIPTRNEKKKKA